jgi:peptidyl-prolyl cis-trans isomerase SurA
MAIAIACGATSVIAQDVMRIAAVVNDHVISVFDLETRINLAVNSSNLQNTEEIRRRLAGPIMRNLIDEALQIQEAERQGIRVSDRDVEIALGQIEANNNLAPGGLTDHLRQIGVSRDTVVGQVRAQIAWGKYINQRIRPTIDVSEEEIDSEIALLEENKGRPEYLVSEISLYFDAQSTEADVEETARSLVSELRGGASFAAIASQFSQGSMARGGGNLGWLREGQSRPQFDETLAKMEVGTISGPIRLLDGVHILQLRDKRVGAVGSQGVLEVFLSQIMLPSADGEPASAESDRIALAGSIGDSVEGCVALNERGKELESSLSGDVGWVKMGDLPVEFRETVSTLEVGQPSAPIKTAAGIHVLMVCERRDPNSEVDMRDVIYERIATQRLSIVERRLLRDLRRTAFVDLRV